MLLPTVPREIFARRFWQNPSHLQHVRWGTTAQSIKTWEEDSGASPFLYGGSLGHAAAAKQPIAKQPAAQTPRLSPTKSPLEASQVDIKKRERTSSAEASAPQGKITTALLSRDENPIRDQIEFPTREDYPHVPFSFTNPKAGISDALKGKANIQAKFTLVRSRQKEQGTRQCNVTCVFHGTHESYVGTGCGSSNVSVADRLMSRLTVSRNPQRSLHTRI